MVGEFILAYYSETCNTFLAEFHYNYYMNLIEIKTILLFIILFVISRCNGTNIVLGMNSPVVTPTSIPFFRSPTLPYIPSPTPTSSTPPLIITQTETSATQSPTIPATATPTTGTLLEILGCNTSLDITHQMGEVTNVYPILRNTTEKGLTNVCATLSASDEARPHPDKTICVPILLNGFQVILKLTVDTGLKKDTSIRVDVTSNEGLSSSSSRPSCTTIGFPNIGPDKIGVVEPIP